MVLKTLENIVDPELNMDVIESILIGFFVSCT